METVINLIDLYMAISHPCRFEKESDGEIMQPVLKVGEDYIIFWLDGCVSVKQESGYSTEYVDNVQEAIDLYNLNIGKWA